MGQVLFKKVKLKRIYSHDKLINGKCIFNEIANF